MANAFKCDVCGNFFELQPLRDFIGGKNKEGVSVNLRLFMLDKHGHKACDFEQWDLCPECYEKLKQFLNPKVENVQSENNTDCFEKEMTQEEAFKLMQETWCWKCKGLSEDGVCRKSLPRSGRSCVDAVMSNEIPEAFEEVEVNLKSWLEEMKNEN